MIGKIVGKAYYVDAPVDTAYRMPDNVMDALVDADVDNIVIVTPIKRLVATVEDWQEYGRQTYDGVILPVSFMAVA